MKSADEMKALHGKDYVERFEAGQSAQRLARLLVHVPLQPQWDVADFGCGSGLLMPAVAPRVRSYAGVDFSEAFIGAAEARRARLGLGNAAFHCASIEDFCAAHPARYHAAFAMDLSEHVYDREWSAILRAVFLALRPGGRFYLHTPNARFFLEIMKQHDVIVKQFPEHVAVRTPEENAALLVGAGFRIERLLLLPHYNVLRYLHPLSQVPGLGRYFQARIFIEALKDARD